MRLVGGGEEEEVAADARDGTRLEGGARLLPAGEEPLRQQRQRVLTLASPQLDRRALPQTPRKKTTQILTGSADLQNYNMSRRARGHAYSVGTQLSPRLFADAACLCRRITILTRSATVTVTSLPGTTITVIINMKTRIGNTELVG
eukprot:702801-Prorocentrum_minimum.AAC.3